MHTYMNINMTIFHGLTMFIFWIIVFYLISSILGKDKIQEESTLDILKKRLAKGDITSEQYQEIRKTIV